MLCAFRVLHWRKSDFNGFKQLGNLSKMLTPSGWTVLVLKKMSIRWCSSPRSGDDLEVGEVQGYYTRLLWTIPEEEEDTSHRGEHLIHLRKKSVMRTSAGNDCNCNLLMKCMQLKASFAASLKKLRRNGRLHNAKTQGTTISQPKVSAKAIASCPHRSRADEEELSCQCKEIMELYTSISQGKLSLDKILTLRL